MINIPRPAKLTSSPVVIELSESDTDGSITSGSTSTALVCLANHCHAFTPFSS